MATNKIELSVGAKKQVSKPATGMGVKSAADIGKQALSVGKQSVKTQTLMLQETKKLVKSLESVDKSINNLKSSIEKNNASMKAGGGKVNTGGGIGGDGGGIGQMGASIPFIGAAIAGFGYLAKKVMDLGKASREALMEQKGTAGISGTVGYNVGIFDPTEVAQYRKTRRMQSGRLQSEAVIKEDSRAYRYAERFGDISSVAQVQGLMDRMAQGAGGPGGTKGIEDVLRITAKEGGIQTELPLMMRMMEDVMETAVSNGVKDSGLSESFAKEVASFSAADPSRSLKSIQKTIEQRRQISDSLAKGGYGQNALTARTTALSMKMIGEDEGLRRELGTKLGISKERVEGNQLSWSEKMAMVSLMQEGAGGISAGEKMQQKIATEAGSAARYITMMQQVYQSNLTSSELLANYNKAVGNQPTAPIQTDITETGVGGEAMRQAKLMAGQKAMRISHPGAVRAREELYNVEQSMFNLAKETAPLVAVGLEKIDKAARISAEGIGVLVDKLDLLMKVSNTSKTSDWKNLGKNLLQFVTD